MKYEEAEDLQKIADEIGISRQTFSKKLQDNLFEVSDVLALKRLVFNE